MKEKKLIKILISFTSELIDDVREIELFINNRNKLDMAKDIFYQLTILKEFKTNADYLQEEFKHLISACDIFISLLYTKLGTYTFEEFEIASQISKKINKPHIFVFFKEAPINLNKIDFTELNRLLKFKEDLEKNGFFYNKYQNIDNLKLILTNQFELLSSQKIAGGDNERDKKSLSVFISYNHKDSTKANQIKEQLKASGFKVIIDSENMYPGADIESFISDSIVNTNITLSIISRNSLLSSWVALESIESFNKESKDIRKFIPVVLENSFFDRKFTGEALESIDKELFEIVEILKTRLDMRTGFADLYGEFKRYLALRNNIDEIVRRLRESLSVDISEGLYDIGMKKLIKYLDEFNANSDVKKNS